MNFKTTLTAESFNVDNKKILSWKWKSQYFILILAIVFVLLTHRRMKLFVRDHYLKF